MPFICAIDTVCQGVVASWRDDEDKPVIYETREAAEEDANDAVSMDLTDEPDMVIEVVVTPNQIVDAVNSRIYWEQGK